MNSHYSSNSYSISFQLWPAATQSSNPFGRGSINLEKK